MDITLYNECVRMNEYTARVSVIKSDHPENQEITLSVVAYSRNYNAISSMQISLNEKNAGLLADHINAALGHAWPKEF